jgi:hypothetical protein
MMFMASKYDSHLNDVLDWRRQGKTWEEISRKVTESGTPATRQAIRAWFLRRGNRAMKIAKQLAPFDALKNQKQDKPTAQNILQKVSEEPPTLTPEPMASPAFDSETAEAFPTEKINSPILKILKPKQP